VEVKGINNNTDLESFIKALQEANSEHFLSLKGSGQLGIGCGYCPPNVYVKSSTGAYAPACVRLDATLGVVVEEKE
jgi:hypothetical protein